MLLFFSFSLYSPNTSVHTYNVVKINRQMNPIFSISSAKHWVANQNLQYNYNIYQKLFNVDIPAPRKGKLTANPSGKFCIPIPTAKFLQKKNNQGHICWFYMNVICDTFQLKNRNKSSNSSIIAGAQLYKKLMS